MTTRHCFLFTTCSLALFASLLAGALTGCTRNETHVDADTGPPGGIQGMLARAQKYAPTPPSLSSRFTVEQRKQIYLALSDAAQRGAVEATKAVPVHEVPTGTSEQADKEYDHQASLMHELAVKYQAPVCARYKIDAAQVVALTNEGMNNNWPTSSGKSGKK